MFEELIAQMAREVEKLSYELNVTLPNEIRKAVELGDLKENSEYKSAKERQQFVQARLGQLTKRMSELSKIDPSAMPFDRVGFGSRVKVMNVAMKAVGLGGTIKAELDRASRFAAGLFGLATQEEVSALRSTVQSLEDNLSARDSKAGGIGRASCRERVYLCV